MQLQIAEFVNMLCYFIKAYSRFEVMLEIFDIATPLGVFQVVSCNEQVTQIHIPGNSASTRSQQAQKPASKFTREAHRQLHAYFKKAVMNFDLAFHLQGTDFQQRVWKQIHAIKPGTVVTYGELADRLGSSARAVGNACRRNPVPILVPCHRVVAKSGVGGFAGKTRGKNINIKQWLLQHEGVKLV